MTTEQFQTKWLPERSPKSGNAFEVPRDAGVLEEDNEDLEDLVVRTFNRKEQRVIRKEASRFYVSEFSNEDLKTTTNKHRLNYIVHMLKAAVMPSVDNVTVLRYIVRHGSKIVETKN